MCDLRFFRLKVENSIFIPNPGQKTPLLSLLCRVRRRGQMKLMATIIERRTLQLITGMNNKGGGINPQSKIPNSKPKIPNRKFPIENPPILHPKSSWGSAVA
jgi:hypothetical protein